MDKSQEEMGELEVLEKVSNSPELMDKILETPKVQLLIQQRFFSGPIPPPDMLVQYNQASPGAADRIISMAEKEQTHRHSRESSNDVADNKIKVRGQWLGIVSLFLILLLAGYLAYLGHPNSAVTLAIGTVASVVGIFVFGKKIQSSENTNQEGK